MPAAVIMPALELAQETGTVVRWLKAEGDSVDKGEDIVEVESAKVNEMVQSPAAGRIVRLVVAEGDTVPVQAILAELDPA